MSGTDLVRIGQIAAAHGIRGEVKIRCFTEASENIGAFGPLRDADGRELILSAIRPAKGQFVIARVAGIGDRNAAEALAGRDLFIPRENLPAPDVEEWYYADLIGLRAVGPDGGVVGTVTALHDFGAGDIVEISPANGPGIMVPFTRQCVPDINIESGTITIEPPRDADEL